MSGFRQGDIVLIPHAPYSDQLQTKARPCLIISSDEFNNSQADVVCLVISSKLRPEDPTRIDIIADRSAAFAQTGLRMSSSIKCSVIFTYQADLIPRVLGHLPPRLMEAAKRTVAHIIGL